MKDNTARKPYLAVDNSNKQKRDVSSSEVNKILGFMRKVPHNYIRENENTSQHYSVISNGILGNTYNDYDKIVLEQTLYETMKQIAIHSNDGNGGGGNMDLEKRVSRLEEKTSSIETIVARIDERTKKLDNMPTKSEVENIIIKAIENKSIPSNSDVELKISNAKNAQIKWTIGIVTTVATIAVTIISLQI